MGVALVGDHSECCAVHGRAGCQRTRRRGVGSRGPGKRKQRGGRDLVGRRTAVARTGRAHDEGARTESQSAAQDGAPVNGCAHHGGAAL